MATSDVDVCNAALGKLGQDITIASLSEQTKHARAFNRVFDRVRDYVNADFPWPFAIKSAALALDAQTAIGWTYRYSYPSDCLDALAVCAEDGVRMAQAAVVGGCDDRIGVDARYDFEVQHGDQDTSIVTDLASAYLIYVRRVEDMARWSVHAIEGLTCRLAIEVAPVIAAEVGLRLGPQLEQKYIAAKSRAGVHALNESRDTLQPTTPSLAARN